MTKNNIINLYPLDTSQDRRNVLFSTFVQFSQSCLAFLTKYSTGQNRGAGDEKRMFHLSFELNVRPENTFVQLVPRLALLVVIIGN